MRGRNLLGWFVGLSLVVAGCSGVEPTTPAPTPTTSAPPVITTEASTASTEPPLVFDSRAHQGDLPRTVAYKGLAWTVTDARVSNQDHSPIAKPGDPTDEYSVTVDISVESSYSDALVRFALDDLFRLDLGNGELLTPLTDVETDLSPNDSVGPGEVGSLSVSYAADAAADLSNAALVIGETGLRPARVPFEGPPAVSGYPIELDVSVDEEIVLEAGCFTDPARLEILGGRLDIDITVDEDDVLNVDPETNAVTPVERRAPIGYRFVELDLRVSTQSAGACGGSLVSAEDFVVEIDGAVRAHDWDPGIQASEVLKSGQAIEFGVGYTVPADLDALVLLAGYRSGDPLRIEIMLPAEPSR